MAYACGVETEPRTVIASVWIEPAGDEIIIGSVRFPDVKINVPLRTLEAWCLRKLREEALQPDQAA